MGASQILDAILSEARQDADAAIADAQSTAQNAIKADVEAANAQAKELIAQTEEDARMAAERDMLAANLEARKAKTNPISTFWTRYRYRTYSSIFSFR